MFDDEIRAKLDELRAILLAIDPEEAKRHLVELSNVVLVSEDGEYYMLSKEKDLKTAVVSEIHEEARQQEELAVEHFMKKETHIGHAKADTARSLRLAANYLDGVNAGPS